MDGQLNQSRFASALMMLAGIWVALSPIWISLTGGALVSVIATGSVIALAGLVQMFWKAVVPSWVAALAAVWLFASAFIYTINTGASWNQVIVAVATIVLAYWDGFEVSHVRQHQIHRAQ
jgi:hypothetical protein